MLLLVAILFAVIANALETVPSLHAYEPQFEALEWGFTIFFSIEYALRLWCVRSARRYAFSFLGVIDMLSIAPTYLTPALRGHGRLRQPSRPALAPRLSCLSARSLLGRRRSHESGAIRASFYRIAVFLVFVLVVVVIVGGLIHYIEYDPNWDPAKGPQPFDSVPRGVYWAIVTLTTVGYGDISPANPLGQFLAACLMLMGYGVIAVPTGIVTAEMIRGAKGQPADGGDNTPPSAAMKVRLCHECGTPEDDFQARFCRMCATPYADGKTRVAASGVPEPPSDPNPDELIEAGRKRSSAPDPPPLPDHPRL